MNQVPEAPALPLAKQQTYAQIEDVLYSAVMEFHVRDKHPEMWRVLALIETAKRAVITEIECDRLHPVHPSAEERLNPVYPSADEQCPPTPRNTGVLQEPSKDEVAREAERLK